MPFHPRLRAVLHALLKARVWTLLLTTLLSRSAWANTPSVQVTNNAPGANTVSWQAPPTPGYVIDYLVERETPAASWVYEVRAGTHIDLGLQPSTKYRYRVCELGAETDCSPWIEVTTMAAIPSYGEYPAPSFTGYQARTDGVTLEWTAPRAYDFFQVRRGELQWKTGGGTANSFSESGLESDQNYTYIVEGCVSSLFSSICSAWSIPMTVQTQPIVPPPPPPPNDDGVLYGVTANGDLLWYRHDGYVDGTFNWDPNSGARVGNGWHLKQLFSGGDGVLYGINEAGDLLWYRHDGRQDGTFAWAPNSGARVGTGWNFKYVFSDGAGVIYAINEAGDLLWYHHDGHLDGTFRWAPTSGVKVGTGWNHFKQVFGAGGGVIYAVTEEMGLTSLTKDGRPGPTTPAGNLLWYRHDGHQDGSSRWAANSGNKVGVGWNFRQLFAGTDGTIYGVTERQEAQYVTVDGRARPATLGGDLLWYRHDGRNDGTFVWAAGSGARVGNGWNFQLLLGTLH